MMKNGLIVDEKGTKMWYLDDKLHRTDGPAMEKVDGTKAWYVNGKCHRIDGPAVEYFNGAKVWIRNNKCLGFGDEGFWVLWDKLNNKQRSNLDLLMHLPKI